MNFARIKLSLLALALMSIGGAVSGQNSLPDASQPIRGRIVRYDWILHETTLNDDFVVETLPDEKGKSSYVRICWYPPWQGFEGPPDSTPHLDRLAFVGAGSNWLFTVFPTKIGRCAKIPPDPELLDESKKPKRLPRYFATPGAEGESVPPINTLPCFQLQKPMSQDKQQSAAQPVIDPKTGNLRIETPVTAAPTTH